MVDEDDEFPPRSDADVLDFLAGFLDHRDSWGKAEIEMIATAVAETGRHVNGDPGADRLASPGLSTDGSEPPTHLLGDPILDPATAEHLGDQIWGRFSSWLPNGTRVRQIGYRPLRARVEVEGANGERCRRTIRTYDDARQVAQMALDWDRGEFVGVPAKR